MSNFDTLFCPIFRQKGGKMSSFWFYAICLWVQSPYFPSKILDTDGSAPANMGQREKERRKRVVRHLFFPPLLKIAKPPDCTGLRFQGNHVHSQLSDLVKEGVWWGSGCEVLLSSSISYSHCVNSFQSKFKVLKISLSICLRRYLLPRCCLP